MLTPAQTMAAAVELLPTRERNVVIRRYRHGESYQQIGDRYGVTAPRAYQIHRRALRRLRGNEAVRALFVRPEGTPGEPSKPS